MAKAKRKRAGIAAPASADEVMTMLKGDILGRHMDDLAERAFGLQLMARRQYDPKPSIGACTPKTICTAGILCLITEGKGRVGCGKTGIFRPDCPVVKA